MFSEVLIIGLKLPTHLVLLKKVPFFKFNPISFIKTSKFSFGIIIFFKSILKSTLFKCAVIFLFFIFSMKLNSMSSIIIATLLSMTLRIVGVLLFLELVLKT